MAKIGKEEKKFFDALERAFIGAEIAGEGGFVNLMRIKSNYYHSFIQDLNNFINLQTKNFPEFKIELYQKLFDFFNRYIEQNGSIMHGKTGFHNGIYARVFSNTNDVSLFWKTQNLHYIKTDYLVNSLPVTIDGKEIFFDASEFAGKKKNQKFKFLYEFNSNKAGSAMVIDVKIAKNQSNTKFDELAKKVKQYDAQITTDILWKAIKIFEKQISIDYFISKNSKSFLTEQFELWLFQYVQEGGEFWRTERINQLSALRTVALKVIEFISKFEEEILKIWRKPRMVTNCSYVISKSRLSQSQLNLLLNHEGIDRQIEEWQKLGICESKFKKANLSEVKFDHIPFDTKYFKDVENEFLSEFDNLDSAIDGWLINSENFQALDSIQKRFKSQVQTIYIDPPFNTGQDFEYLDNYQDSTWLSLMLDRLNLSIQLLNDSGCYWLHLDYNANVYGRELLSNHFSDITEIVYSTNATKDEEADVFGYKSFGDNFQLKHQTIYYARKDRYKFHKLWKPNRNVSKLPIGWLDLIAVPNKSKPSKIVDYDYVIEKWNKDNLIQENIEIAEDEKIYPIGTIWSDIFSFTQSEMRVSESFSFASSQKPENLLRRILQSTTSPGELVLDFFTGIGTTAAVAHKLGRKWIAIEMGNHIDETYRNEKDEIRLGVLGRLKWVLNGDQKMTFQESTRRPHLSKDVNWQGGGFFRYLEFEQYEDILQHSKYNDSELLDFEKRDNNFEYLFFRDQKLINKSLIREIDGEIYIDLTKIYSSIDIPVTISLLTGLKISKIELDNFLLEDGSKYRFDEIPLSIAKSLFWW